MANQSSSSVFVVLALAVLGAAGWLYFASGPGAGGVASSAPTPVASAGETEASSLTSASAASAAETGPAARGPGVMRTEVQGAAAEVRFHLTGRLLDAREQPVAQVDVGLVRLTGVGSEAVAIDIDEPVTTTAVASMPDRTRSGADGRFDLTLPAGVGGRLRILGGDFYLSEASAGDSRTALRVSALTGDRDLGDLVLGRTARVSGVVRNAAGKAVEGVRVAVHRGDSPAGALGFTGGGVTTGADGTFAQGGLLPGDYTVATASPDHLPAAVKVTLAEGEHRRDLVVVVQAGREIAGTVVDDLGQPLPEMRVAADRSRQLAPGVQIQATNSSEATRTDASGRFVLRGLESATVNVEAWGPGHARASLRGVEAGTTNLVLELPRLGSVAGRLVDEAGAPIAGSDVNVAVDAAAGEPLLLDANRAVKTDAEGNFVLDTVRPGAVRVVASGAHLRVQSDPIDVRPGQRYEGLRLVAVRGASLVVHVKDKAGQPVAGAQVEVSEAPSGDDPLPTGGRRAMRISRRVANEPGRAVMFGAPTVLGSATTDDQGTAQIDGLKAGLVVAKASGAKHAPGTTAPLSVPAAGKVEAELTLVAGGFVQLRALDAQNGALAGAHYKLVADALAGGEPRVETGTCDAGGLALIGPLPEGTWTVRLCLPPRPMELGAGMSFVMPGMGGSDLTQTDTKVEVVAEKTVDVTLAQPQLTKLVGVVRDAKGPVEGARVELAQNDAGGPVLGLEAAYKAKTEASGSFEVSDLPPGDYVLRYGYGDALALAEQPLHVSAGEARVEKDLTLRTGTVKLVVRGEDGEPVARARVTLDLAGSGSAPRPRREIRMVAIATRSDDNGSSGTTSISAGTPSATTDTDGEVEILRVPEGKYSLRIEHARHVTTQRADVQVADGVTTDLGVLTLAPGGELRGRVVAADGSDVQFATVEVTPLPSGEARNETAMGGNFQVTGLAAGKYRVRASLPIGPGEHPQTSGDQEVELAKGEKRTLELRLQ